METQEAVNYRQGSEEMSCAMCKHFNPDGTCALVAGAIAPEGLCDLFEPFDAPVPTDDFLFGV